jgi:hypothetical protein
MERGVTIVLGPAEVFYSYLINVVAKFIEVQSNHVKYMCYCMIILSKYVMTCLESVTFM